MTDGQSPWSTGNGLPEAEPTPPYCGACGDPTETHDNEYECEACQLVYDPITYRAERDTTKPECGLPCPDDTGPTDTTTPLAESQPHHKFRIVHHPCRLTQGHTSKHWGGCYMKWA